MVVTHILPFTETKPAILSDGDGFLASGIAFEALHMVVPYACELIARLQRRPPINRQLTQWHQLALNGVLLLTVLTHVEEGE